MNILDLIGADDLSTPVDIQITEYQIRPLSKLEPAQQREAWQKAVDTAPDGKVTAAHVSKVVKEITGEQPKHKPEPKPTIPEHNEDSDALFHLKRWWKKTTKKDRRVFIEWTKEEGL